jgi:hypothetical protein
MWFRHWVNIFLFLVEFLIFVHANLTHQIAHECLPHFICLVTQQLMLVNGFPSNSFLWINGKTLSNEILRIVGDFDILRKLRWIIFYFLQDFHIVNCIVWVITCKKLKIDHSY